MPLFPFPFHTSAPRVNLNSTDVFSRVLAAGQVARPVLTVVYPKVFAALQSPYSGH